MGSLWGMSIVSYYDIRSVILWLQSWLSHSFITLWWCIRCETCKYRLTDAWRWPPNTLPIVGNGFLFLQSRHKLFSWFVKCERQFGFETFQIYVPSLPPGLVISDPKNLEYVLRNEGTFAKGNFFKKRSWDLFGKWTVWPHADLTNSGNGIINADGDLWKVQRKAGLHFLNNANLKILTETALPHYLQGSVRILEEAKESATVDLEEIFHELTTQVMGRMAYNASLPRFLCTE